MKNCLVEISFFNPYPVKKEYRVTASNLGLAGYRAFKNWRKDYKGKKIKEMNFKVIRL